MNSENIRTIETSISVSQVKSQIETWLRAIDVIRDDEILLDLNIGPDKKGLKVNGKETDILPLKFSILKEEVTVIKNGKTET